ncbi:MAG: threonine synthase [Chloroflexi bacterium]|nr:threonine synthase [Chloroflexota bacterium]
MFRLVCLTCERTCQDLKAANCPHDGGLLDVRYDSADIPLQSELPGIWPYASHLPLIDEQHIVSLGEGDTPLLPASSLGNDIDLPQLYFKNEGLNPTGSYKDRIATVGITYLRQLGKQAWAATSSGNAGASLAAYGARAGLDGYLFTLERAPRSKIAQIIAYGPQVKSVKRLGYDPAAEKATWANIAAICDANDWLMLITARSNSPQSMEGAKTISYEVCQQLHNDPPDVVYVPVGGGGLLSSIWKGFREWRAAGYIDRLPRMVAVQPQGCDPISQAWREGRPVQPLDDCASAVSGIILTSPPDGDLVLQDLRESDGWALSIPDEVTYQAQSELASEEGIFVEPAAAVVWAAIKEDRRAGRLRGDEKVVGILTGIGFKDSQALQRMTAEVPLPMIEAEEILQIRHN